MSVIDIATAMQHLRADGEDQSYVQVLLEAAEQSAQDYLGRRFFASTEALAEAVEAGRAGEEPMLINPAVVAACLLILGSLYANREDVVVGVSVALLPSGSRSLLFPHRVGLGV
ncbi:head-tail connector protein [Pseudomonas guariconensis]|uniref:head-tail connector protein n=1 Tax=Pseudomonas guariconensis TaxID=1288410 RepID=UPI0039ECDAA2